MTKLWKRFVIGCVVLVAGCQAPQTSKVDPPTNKQASVAGVNLKYLEQGQGATVVFVHGAFADHRVWEAQREVVAQGYRYIALDQRYFGNAPWPDDGSKYSLVTHTSDLAAFIRQSNAGPVHVVAWSYGGSIALALAVQHPELVRSLFLNEPALTSIVSDPADVKTLAEERKGVGPAAAASKANDLPESVRLFADWVNAQPGGFDTIQPSIRTVFLDNSRTIPLHFAAPPPPPITCAQLGQIKVPVTVTKGQLTRPFFAILADTTSRCVPGSQLVIVPNARHLAPTENASAFNAALLDHLERQ